MDERFESINRDHRFRPIRQTQRKVQIDKRFHGIFFNKSFRENFTVDKRGKPIRESTTKNLRKFYHLSREERKRIHKERIKDRELRRKKLEGKKDTLKENGTLGNLETNKVQTSKSNQASTGNLAFENADGMNSETRQISAAESDSDSSYLDSEDDSDVDLARGKGNIESSDEDEEDETLALENNNVPDHGWGEMDHEAPRSEDSSHRLALCGMDWDRVKVEDIFVLLDSFKPAGGLIKSVTIYPSAFGMKRMVQEEKAGPAELKEMRSDDHEAEWAKDGDEQYNIEKLRQYQLNRLKYYYAIIICDSVNTAEKLYNDCDGIEFENSCSKLDLRFIPNEMKFNDHPPKEQLTSAPDPMTYKPALFVTAALNQTKVELTWDETDFKRTALTNTKFTREELETMDVKDFLASGSSSEEEEDEGVLGDSENRLERKSKMDEKERAEMYRKLLLEGCEEEDKKKDQDVDMEITWEPDLKLKIEEDMLGAKPKTVKKVESSEKEIREEAQTSQAELEMVMLGDDGKFKGANGDPKEFEIDVADERFSALYKSSRYTIDMSNSSFKKSEAMEKIFQERQARINKEGEVIDDGKPSDETSAKKGSDGLEQLVKSVKTKSAWLGKKSKRTK